MAENDNKALHLSKESFSFVHSGEKISDKVFEDKPVGYLKDAWRRFRKNQASVIAAVIIIAIILYAFVVPLVSPLSSRFMDSYYSKKAPRSRLFQSMGFMDGGVKRDFSEKSLVKAVAVGVGAEDWDGRGVSVAEGLKSKYQPMIQIGDPVEKRKGKNVDRNYAGRIDVYLEVGFMYQSIPQKEYEQIRKWEEETGLHVLYPLVEDNQWNVDYNDANNWYKSKKSKPVQINEKGKATGGQPGDQTGKEFLIRSYRNYPWTHILRFKGSSASVGDFRTPSKSVRYTGIVATKSDPLNVRKGPGTEYGLCQTFGPLAKGTQVDVCDTTTAADGSTWLYICYRGAKYGFVSAKYIREV